MSHPFRFGVNATSLASRSSWQDRARRLEAEGWSTLLVPDHLGAVSTFAPLVSAADATTELRVGTLVVNNDLFHPLRLAQEAATVDLLTDGRLELGVGSGWNEPEYRLLDRAYDRPGRRAERVAQALTAMKKAWAGDTVVAGRNVRAVPEAVQHPHPRLLVGGHGDRILTVAATEADIVGFTGLTWNGSHLAATGASLAALAERVDLVRRRAGDRFAALELNVLAQGVAVGGDTEAAVARWSEDLELPPGLVRETPLTLIGSVDEVVDKLVSVRERLGISYVVVRDTAIEAMGPVVARLAGT